MGYACTFLLFTDQSRQGCVCKDIWRDLARYLTVAEVAHITGQFVTFDVCLLGNLFNVHLRITKYVRHIGLDANLKGYTIMKLKVHLAVGKWLAMSLSLHR